MPLKRMLCFTPTGSLNDTDDTVASGLVEPITGIELPSGLVLGDTFQLTTSEALAASNTTIGTLLAGFYQRVYMNASAVSLKRGQLLWLVNGGTYKHEVTNTEPADLSPLYGIFINKDAGVTAGNFCFIQLLMAGEGTVLYKTALTGVPAVGQTVYAAGAGVGADNARTDVLDGAGNPTFTQVGNLIGRTVGQALELPVANSLKKVYLNGNRMVVD